MKLRGVVFFSDNTNVTYDSPANVWACTNVGTVNFAKKHIIFRSRTTMTYTGSIITIIDIFGISHTFYHKYGLIINTLKLLTVVELFTFQ